MARTIAANRVAVANRYTPISAATAISGCVLWVDSTISASVVRDGSDKVSQWTDQSGAGNHLVQATGGSQPTYNAASTLGFPSIVFDGVADFMQATFTLAQPWTAVVAVRMGAAGGLGANDCIFDGKNNVSGVLVCSAPAASNALQVNAGANIVISFTATPLDALGYAVPWCVFNGASSLFGIDEQQYRTANAGANAAGGFTIGTLGSGAAGRCVSAEFTHVAVYNVALTMAQIRQVVRLFRGQ